MKSPVSKGLKMMGHSTPLLFFVMLKEDILIYIYSREKEQTYQNLYLLLVNPARKGIKKL